MKVNHAGEHGAISIYTAQIALAHLTAPSVVEELIEFRTHECRHRAIFAAELQRRGRRRCRSYWLCGIGGFALGAITGLFGRNAISATTMAVESVVLRHLRHQIILLTDVDPQAVEAISSIVQEEQQHHDQSAANAPVRGFWISLLKPIVSTSTEAVIWLGMKL